MAKTSKRPRLDRYRRLWRELLSSMRTELYLAERDYGVKIVGRKYDDLKWKNAGRVDVLRKMLDEAKKSVRRQR